MHRERNMRPMYLLEWRHNEGDGVSNHRRLACLLNRLFRRRSKKASELRVTDLCEGNPPVTGGFPSQMASNAENVSIWRHRHVVVRDVVSYYVMCASLGSVFIKRDQLIHDQISRENHLPVYNFTHTVMTSCDIWEGLSLRFILCC